MERFMYTICIHGTWKKVRFMYMQYVLAHIPRIGRLGVQFRYRLCIHRISMIWRYSRYTWHFNLWFLINSVCILDLERAYPHLQALASMEVSQFLQVYRVQQHIIMRDWGTPQLLETIRTYMLLIRKYLISLIRTYMHTCSLGYSDCACRKRDPHAQSG